jgi:dehydrogenase/reductase SDR family protein 12
MARFNLIAMPQWYIEGLRYYGHAGYNAAKKKWTDPDMQQQQDLTGKAYIVTGANSGLGFAVAHELAKRNAIVHMVCRDATRGENARRERNTSGSRIIIPLLLQR